MAVAVIQQLIDDVKANHDVIDSAVLLINGIAQRITDAVAAAMANGATAAELQPLTDLSTSIKAKSQVLADAVAASTPAQP